MKISKAVTNRVDKLLVEKQMSRYRLAKNAAISPDTLKSIFHNKTDGVQLKTVLLICKGLDITVAEFFNDDIFDYNNLEFK